MFGLACCAAPFAAHAATLPISGSYGNALGCDGAVFGIPYTLIGLALFRYLLPRNKATFLAVGALCPAAAIFTVGLVLGGQLWLGPEMIRMTVFTLPSGLAAAYLFGAIGLGHGFGRWRMA